MCKICMCESHSLCVFVCWRVWIKYWCEQPSARANTCTTDKKFIDRYINKQTKFLLSLKTSVVVFALTQMAFNSNFRCCFCWPLVWITSNVFQMKTEIHVVLSTANWNRCTWIAATIQQTSVERIVSSYHIIKLWILSQILAYVGNHLRSLMTNRCDDVCLCKRTCVRSYGVIKAYAIAILLLLLLLLLRMM